MSNEDTTVVETIEVVEETVLETPKTEKTKKTKNEKKVETEFQGLIDDGILTAQELEEMKNQVNSYDFKNFSLKEAKSQGHASLEDSTATVDKINSGALVKSTDTEDLLLSINQDIESVMNPTSSNKGISVVKDLFSKLPFAEKVKDDLKKTVARSSTVQKVFDGIFDKLDRQLEDIQKDVSDYEKLYDETSNSLKKLVLQKQLVDHKMKTMSQSEEGETQKGKRELSKWLYMSNNIEGFIFATKTNLDIIHIQLEQSLAAESALNDMKPYLQKQISTQLSLDIKNQKHKAMNEMMGMVRKFANDISLKTLESAGTNAVELIKDGNKPIMEKESIKEMKKIIHKTGQDLSKALNESNKNALEYRKDMKDIKALDYNKSLKNVESNDSASDVQKSLSKEFKEEKKKISNSLSREF